MDVKNSTRQVSKASKRNLPKSQGRGEHVTMPMRAPLFAAFALLVSQPWVPAFASALAEKNASTVPEWRAQLNKNAGVNNKSVSECQGRLEKLIQLETLVKDYSTRSDDPFAELAFPPFECTVLLDNMDTPLTISGSLQPNLKKLPKPAANSDVATVLDTREAQILASQALPLRIKALRLGEIDGIPVLFEARPKSIAAAQAFVDITRQIDTRRLTIPASWRKHIGMFRDLREIRGGAGLYSFSEPETPFLEGVINADGTIIIKPDFDDIDLVESGFIVRTKEGLTGLISADGKTILPVQYRAIADKGDNRLLVYRSDNRLQLFNAENRSFLGKEYDEIAFVDGENLVVVESDGRHEFMTRDMAPAFGKVYSYVRQLPDSKFIVEADGLSSLLDRDGEILIPPDYERLWAHAKHRLIFARNGKTTAYFDYDGRQVSPKNWSVHYAPSVEKGHITVSDPEGRFGVIDKNGKFVIPALYSQIHQFSEGYVPVAKFVEDNLQKNQRFGLVDEDNKLIIPFEYDNLHLVRDGRLWAKKDGKWGLIDMDQSILANFTIDAISRSRKAQDEDGGKERLFMVAKRDGLFGIVRHDTGDVVVPFKYPEARAYALELRAGTQWLSYPCDFKTDLALCNSSGRTAVTIRPAT